MPFTGTERPIWNFLKFQHYRILEDGTIRVTKQTKAEHPWETEKIRSLLDQITNPESFSANQKKYKLMVSEQKATLAEVKELGSRVQKIIEDRKLPGRGIHQERHSMCSALFGRQPLNLNDELIRQVIIEYPDLGEILLRIRDHFRQEIYNYEQVFAASQAYGCRKQFMEKNDERLNELEEEVNYLLKKQEKAIQKVDKAYEENFNLVEEYEDIDVDDFEYWRAVQFYQNYIKYLLYYFDLRAEEEKIKQDIEDKEEDTEEEEEEEQTEGLESFTLGDDVLEEEDEEEPPGIVDEEVKLDTAKQQKEEPIDKDLIYRDNEEEVFDSDLDTEQTIISGIPKSQEDVIPPTETDPQEQMQMLLDEDLKHDISFLDIARGFMKEAYEQELKMIEEQKRLEEEKKRLEEERKKQEAEKSKLKESDRRKQLKRAETGDEVSEEGLAEEEEEEVEEEEEEELARRETLKSVVENESSVRQADGREGSFIRQGSDESETVKEMPFLTKPKYALLRRLTNTLKCKDLIQRIPDVEPSKKRKVKKVLIKKIKAKSKVETPVEEIPEIKEISFAPEAGKESLEEASTAVMESEFKWGLPLLEYFVQIGRKHSYDQEKEDVSDTIDKKEAGAEGTISAPVEEEAVREEESELLSSGLSIGKTESFHSSEESKDESVSIDEEEEDKIEKNKTDEFGEEEDDDESVFSEPVTMADIIIDKGNKTPTKKRTLITTFLKWSAPSMARKDEVYGQTKVPLNIERPISLESKCGELRQVLDCIRPPRAWFEDGIYWRQEVSGEPATRADVVALGEALEQAMVQSNARETGLCELRELIYADLFDELIRQVAINCIERGLLLLRIRNEAEDSIRAFQRLFSSSLAYGVRKTLEADKDMVVLKDEADKLYGEKAILEKELENVMFTIASRERELAERMEEIQTKHKNQLELIMETQSNLKYQLLSITSLNKSKN